MLPHVARHLIPLVFFFFFNDTATTEIYTLSLHDALPISEHHPRRVHRCGHRERAARPRARGRRGVQDRKSTRLNSSHANISYAVFCLKKKKPKGEDINTMRAKMRARLAEIQHGCVLACYL